MHLTPPLPHTGDGGIRFPNPERTCRHESPLFQRFPRVPAGRTAERIAPDGLCFRGAPALADCIGHLRARGRPDGALRVDPNSPLYRNQPLAGRNPGHQPDRHAGCVRSGPDCPERHHADPDPADYFPSRNGSGSAVGDFRTIAGIPVFAEPRPETRQDGQGHPRESRLRPGRQRRKRESRTGGQHRQHSGQILPGTQPGTPSGRLRRRHRRTQEAGG